ncbi:MAG: hypothetical protein V7754_08365 [Halioglobus sp.]
MDAHYCNLEHETLLHITGPDSLKFLQGQTTCDTSEINETHALLGAYCNPQGRMVSDFLLCQLGSDHFAMRLRQDVIARTAETFGKYIIFSKAELDAQNEEWLTIACWGSDIRQALTDIFPAVPETRLNTTMGENFVLVQIDEKGEQFECYLRKGAQAELERILQIGAEANWQALQIASGIGRIEASTIEEFIPQMLNYDITGHVSFTKGCYTGQEVVARMHYRGKPKRRLYLASLAGETEAAAGTPLFSGEGGQSVGNIVNSAPAEGGKTLVLVVATQDGIAGGLKVAEASGPTLELSNLPYTMDKP